MRFKSPFLIAIASLSVAVAGVLIAAESAASPGWPLLWHKQLAQPNQPAQPMQRGLSGDCMMQDMQVSDELSYLSLMIPHHEEAIATAQRVLAESKRPEMREFAQAIIDVQSREIEQMNTWLNDWYPDQTRTVTYTPMMRDLSQLEGDALDQAFLEDMIMHHMGAVMMSRQLVNRGLVVHDPVQPFAETIAATQRQEIWQMRTWLQTWYGATERPGPMGMGGMHDMGGMHGMGNMHRGWSSQ